MLAASPVTSWSSRADVCGGSALDEAELASLVDASLDASLGMLFTATPREELDEIGRFQRLADQAWAGQVRAIVAAYNRTTEAQREFAADEVALALGVSPTAGSRLLTTALDVAGLPGLLESVETGALTQRHALAVVRELSLVELSVEQRHAVVLMALARHAGHTPGELAKVVARLVLTVDLAAAQLRRDKATLGRRVDIRADVDGQAILSARGPVETIAAIKARLNAELDAENLDADDPRTRAQREFDLLTDLLTSAALNDRQPVDYSVAVIIPFSTANGGDLELGEIPGLGPILPSTARDLFRQADTLTQVAIDDSGCVLAVTAVTAVRDVTAVSDVFAGPLRAARDAFHDQPHLHGILDRLTTAPVLRDLSVAGYRIPTRLRRFLEHRDQTCVFPGCNRPASATDKDHRTPWPVGPTSADNLQCLCRHHHRAKQTSFDVTLTDEGHVWTTRGGWQFLRRPKGY